MLEQISEACIASTRTTVGRHWRTGPMTLIGMIFSFKLSDSHLPSRGMTGESPVLALTQTMHQRYTSLWACTRIVGMGTQVQFFEAQTR
jgi:hypothetical protein